MGFFQRLTRMWRGRPVTVISRSVGYTYQGKPREMMDLLRAYYQNNGLYDALYAALFAIGHQDEGLVAVRNPANRVVEFYAAKLWPGPLDALTIVADNDVLTQTIRQVLVWSNFSARKQVWARWQALYGNVFVKVAGDEGRVFLQLIDPRYVVDFVEDARGFIVEVRFDIPRGGGQTLTEVWDRESARFFRHTMGYGVELEQLGDPTWEESLDEMGIDFVPVVHVRQRDAGGQWSAGAFQPVLDKIDEANRLASRLHRMLFRHNKNMWALSANAVSGDGRPIPAPRVNNDGTDELEVGDNTVVRLPGNSTLESLIPQINYDAALATLSAQMGELEQDLPELGYYRLREQGGDLSGRAVRMLLSAAVDRVIEARGNAVAGLVRANAMALTLGTQMGLWDLGTFEAGDFAHTFALRDVIPLTGTERSEIVRNLTQAGLAIATAMQQAGYSEMEIERALADRAAEQEAEQVSLAEALVRAQRDFDRGE
jgi:hypothetical protein